ncbi:MAG: hypothetical protein K2W96_11510 [Gemmataceae bacterium]|nr:hypothetical protein [Gemmataceae bacterium]
MPRFIPFALLLIAGCRPDKDPTDAWPRDAGPAKDDASAATARRWYEEFEERMGKAKAFRVAFRTESEGKGGLRMSGTLAAVEGDRLRIRFDGETDGKRSVVLFACDGGELLLRTEPAGLPAKSVSRPVADGLYEGVASLLAAGGVAQVVQKLSVTIPASCPRLRPASWLSSATEKIEGREARRLDYEITAFGRGGLETAAFSLWLVGGLPAKRTVAVRRGEEVLTRVAETYSEWALDPKLGAKELEVPKR